MRDKLKELLGRGISGAVAASAVGCSESYVSQLLAEAEFAAEVSALKLLHVTKDTQRNDKIDNLKDKLLDQLEKAAQFAYKPGEVLTAAKALQALSTTRSGNETAAAQQVQSQIVQVVLPTVTAASFTRNSLNEVVEVNGRSMATLTPAALKTIINQSKEVPHVQLAGEINPQVATAAVNKTATVDNVAAEAA